MKKLLLAGVSITATNIAMAITILTIAGCDDFSTSYERIDDSEFRLLDFIYEPADIAPGDSVTLTAVFAAGKNKNIGDLGEYIDWWISFDMISDLFGAETVVDSTRLEPIARRIDTAFSAKTQAVAFKFKIPEDIVRTSPSIPERWPDVLPSSMRGMIPPELASIPKNEIVDILEELIDIDPSAYPDSGYALVKHQLRIMLQLFTVPIRVTAMINDPDNKFPRGHKIISGHSVRYNSKFPDIAAVNTNPIIDEIVVFKVKGDVPNFDNKSGHDYTEIKLNAPDNNEIVIEKGYSYFIDAHTKTSSYDNVWTMDGNQMRERHRVFRQFYISGENFHAVNNSKYMDVSNTTGKMTKPSDSRITDFTFWITVYDEAPNERLRPQGSALAEVSGKFVYK